MGFTAHTVLNRLEPFPAVEQKTKEQTMDISAMERSKSRSRRGRSLPGADEYDLEMGRPMKWARNRARSRRRERRRQRRGREQAGPAEDNSSAAMPMMLCACGIVVVFLVGGGIFIAYQRGAFSSGRQRYYQQQPQQQQVHYVTQPNQGYQPTQPNHGSEGTSTDQTTVAEQATSVVGSSRQEQVAELHRRHQIIMSTSTTSYSQLKEHLNWIRLESYWAMTFSNNRAFWRSTNNTRCWFGSNGGRRKNLELSKESVRQKAKELIQTCTSPDRTDVILELCRNSGIHPRIRDILDKAERRCGDKTFTNKFSEAWKEAYVEFYCYCHHVDQVYKKLENDYLVKWYDEDGYVWRHSTWCSVDAKGTPLG